MEPTPKKLLDQVREAIRLKHYSLRTEEAYVAWTRRFILFHDKRHPKEMGRAEIEAFLTHLAVHENVAAICTHVLSRGGLVVCSPLDQSIGLQGATDQK